MAEIVRARTTTTKRNTTDERIGEPPREPKTVEAVTVRSIRSDRMDASCLFDLVRLLEAEGCPGKASVEAKYNDYRSLTELVVKWETEIDEQALADANEHNAGEPVVHEDPDPGMPTDWLPPLAPCTSRCADDPDLMCTHTAGHDTIAFDGNLYDHGNTLAGAHWNEPEAKMCGERNPIRFESNCTLDPGHARIQVAGTWYDHADGDNGWRW